MTDTVARDATVTCPSCGVANPSTSQHCGNCGTALPSSDGSGGPQPAGPSSDQSVDQSIAQSPPQPQTAQASTPAAPPADGFYVGIWGPKASGKTMYLYMLQEHILATRHREWTMVAANDAARRLLNSAADTVIAKRRFPAPTPPHQPEECWFRFTKNPPVGPSKSYHMQVLDMPGEWYERPDEALSADRKKIVQDYLCNCAGLLCLVDPESGESIASFVRFLRNDLAFHGKTNQRLAFCLTKADQKSYVRYLSQPVAYIRQVLRTQTIRAIEDTFNHVRYDFACSAVGFYRDPGSKRIWRDTDGTPHSNSGIDWYGRSIIYNTDARPINLFNPLEWLFEDVS